MTRYLHHINEFAVHSELPLPGDPAARSALDPMRLKPLTLRRASLADLPCTLRRLRRQIAYDVGDGLLLEPGGLSLHVDYGGRTLTVDCPEATWPSAAAWVARNGLSVATLAHGAVPLQAAAVEVAGRCVALLAPPNTGKSTLSWSLIRQGARFGCDDLVPIYWVDDAPVVFPAVSLYPKLRPASVAGCGLTAADLLQTFSLTGEEKFYVPLSRELRMAAPTPLSCALLLNPQPPQHGILRTRRLPPEEAAAAFRSSIHAFSWIGRWVDGKRLEGDCLRLAARVPVYNLPYPSDYAALSESGVAVAHVLAGA